MSTGAIKGLEVLLIAGAVFWFAYSQLNALKRDKPSDAEQTRTSSGDDRPDKAEDVSGSDKDA
jgi:hypothetical protein